MGKEMEMTTVISESPRTTIVVITNVFMSLSLGKTDMIKFFDNAQQNSTLNNAYNKSKSKKAQTWNPKSHTWIQDSTTTLTTQRQEGTLVVTWQDESDCLQCLCTYDEIDA